MKNLKPVATLSPQDFKFVVEKTPLVSIDLIIHDGRNLLLGLRRNAPSQNSYFVPGGCVFKNEALSDAFTRISSKELSNQLSFEKSQFIGVIQEFYPDNFAKDPAFGTHYISLGYAHKVDFSEFVPVPDDQHSKYLVATIN